MTANETMTVPDSIAEHILKYVQEQTRDAMCPMCHTRKWLAESKPYTEGLNALLGLASPLPAYLITDVNAFWQGPPTIPTLVLTCENCGFVRLHNLSHLLKKVGTP